MSCAVELPYCAAFNCGFEVEKHFCTVASKIYAIIPEKDSRSRRGQNTIQPPVSNGGSPMGSAMAPRSTAVPGVMKLWRVCVGVESRVL